jgi:hypothetical protein
MSNLVGPDYDKPCPICGKPMGNAAGLGICSVCDMTSHKDPIVLTVPLDHTVGFLEGFVPLDLPLIKAPMMAPYGVRTVYNKDANTLTIIQRRFRYRIHDEYIFENDEDEFFPADDISEQNSFLMRLTRVVTDYYHNLSVCCQRRGSGGTDNDIGYLPEIKLPIATVEVLKREQ